LGLCGYINDDAEIDAKEKAPVEKKNEPIEVTEAASAGADAQLGDDHTGMGGIRRKSASRDLS
jgi:hypothetical protein